MQNTFGNFSTPMISVSDKKRKDTEIVNGPAVGKKPRGRPPGRKNQVQGIIFCASIKYMLSFHYSSIGFLVYLHV